MSPGGTGALNAAQRQKATRGDRDLTAQHLVLGLLTLTVRQTWNMAP
jgi:hypothetical protein